MPAFKKVNKGGAPPKLNEELIDKIMNNLRLGVYLETAVVCAGVHKAIFYEWVKQAHRDRKENKVTLKTKLLDAVDRATEEATMRDVMNIDKCAMGKDPEYERDESGQLILNGRGNPIIKKYGMAPDWQASAWRLQRRKPKEWGTSQESNDNKTIQPQIIVQLPSNGREANNKD